ncbi:MAG: thioredoxin [Planctomycetaceae bacterium]|nr:thioredoxin [Planctomycetaceae bacterium]
MTKVMPMSMLVLMMILVVLIGASVSCGVAPDSPTAQPAEPMPDKTNRLSGETSPYLLQHQHNPVAWYPWGEEAFAKAAAEDKPIFLSVGYSTCHWCHVMAHESFEHEDVAAILNEHYVAIKVDREERPDIDAQYMMATQLATGRGGWPNSVWLTPDGRPWSAGTYWPRDQFKAILTRLAERWRDNRQEVEQMADRFATAIQEYGAPDLDATEKRELTPEFVGLAIQSYLSQYDQKNGGFGGAGQQKFPPHGRLALMAEVALRDSNEHLIKVYTHTLDAMARGGVHDHVGGGFHRYATDDHWFLPHFEKMLYDNAPLLRAYTDAYLLTKREKYRTLVTDIVTWLEREMLDGDGGFYSALDADSEGEEGKYYVWSIAEVMEVLGEAEGELFCGVYGLTEEGNFVEEATGHRTGTNVIFLPGGISLPEEMAKDATDRGADIEALVEQLSGARGKLLAARYERVRPHLDDKVLTAWNAMMIDSLAYAARVLDEPHYLDLADRAADFVLTHMVRDGRLQRTYRAGEAKIDGYVDDYGLMIHALLELHAVTGDARRVDQATQLADRMLAEFQDEVGGGFFFTPAEHDEKIFRSKDLIGGGNVPSGNGAAARALTRLAVVTGEARFADAARDMLRALSGLMWARASATEYLNLAAAEYLRSDLKSLGDAPMTVGTDGEMPVAWVYKEPVTVKAFAESLSGEPGDVIDVRLELLMDEGWHIYANEPGAERLIPTSVALVDRAGITLEAMDYPAGTERRYGDIDETVNVHEGRLELTARLRIAAEAEPGKAATTLQVTAQACNDAGLCLEREVHLLEFGVTVESAE